MPPLGRQMWVPYIAECVPIDTVAPTDGDRALHAPAGLSCLLEGLYGFGSADFCPGQRANGDRGFCRESILSWHNTRCQLFYACFLGWHDLFLLYDDIGRRCRVQGIPWR
jgi:hypothetical protein